MGQPNPPGDIPLIEGLGSEWNDVVSAIPEDQRADVAARLRDNLSTYEPLKQWEDLHKAGITPDQAGAALSIQNIIDTDPQSVYEAIGRHLGISAAQAEEVVEELEDGDQDDPRIRALQEQVNTLAQVAVATRQQTVAEKAAADADAQLDSEISALKKKYGDDVPEDEVVMRMLHKDLSAEEAYQEYVSRRDDIMKRRPSPMLLGGGGAIPSRAIDVKKLDSKDTKSLVAQMLDHAKNQA